MLPPSSPQTSHAQQGLQLSQSHRPPPPPPPPPPPFSANRELPALSTAPRPGSSMSISSMLGTDPGRSARETIAYSNPPSTIISTTASPSIPTKSPSRLHHNGVGNSQSHSPERYKPTQGVTARPHRAFSGGSPQRPTASAEATVSEISNFGATPSTQPPRYSPLSETGSRQDWKDAHSRHQSAGRIMQRPNSQPSGYGTSPLEVQDKMQQHSATSEIDELRRLQSAKRYLGNTDDNYRATAFGQARRDYIVSRAMPEPEAVPPPERKLANTSAHTSPKQDRLSGSNYSFLTKSSTKTEATSNRVGLQAGSILNRVLERNPPVPPNLSQSPFSPESLRRLREERLVAVGSQHNGTSQFPANQQTRFVENADARQDNMYPRTASVPANLGAPSTIDGVDHQTRTGEEMNQLQKSSLSLFMENQKRGGRVSPLPQAVQGAQGKLSTPASDPGIKSEFARMFIGIGSGVGSAGPMRSETSTPFQRSPIRNHEPERRTPFGNRSDLTEFNKPRARSRNTKRPRKSKEDDFKLDVDREGRASTGIISSRGIKRNKSNNYQCVPLCV